MTNAASATFLSLRPLLDQGLSQLHLQLSELQCVRLLDYVALLEKWNKVYNLTAVREPARMIGLHLLDSLSVLPHLGKGATLIDVGTGGGLPGIPLAIARSDLTISLLDTIAKKTTFVRQVIGEISLENAEAITARVEQFKPDNKFDIVVSRAFAELKDFVECAGHLCSDGGVLLAMKGVYPHDEIARLPESFTVAEVIALNVPQIDGQRHLVVIKKK